MKRKDNKLRITQADYVLAQRRAARLEEIALHGKPVSMRSVKHKSKKIYDRKRLIKNYMDYDDMWRIRMKLTPSFRT